MRGATAGAMNELLLATEEGALLEGSQTNFFAIRDGAVHTAAEGILEGTVRRLVLEVCAREGIPTVLRPPALGSSSEWSGGAWSVIQKLSVFHGAALISEGDGLCSQPF